MQRIVSLVFGRVRHQHQKLISTLAEHHVATAEDQLQHLGEIGQQHVAFKRAEFCIDGAEFIDIQREEGQPCPQTIGAGYFPRNEFVHGAAIQ